LITVIVVDDHDLVRTGVRRLLDELSGIEVLAEASTGEGAVTKMRELNPDVVLLDANMPGIGGFEATRRMVRYNPDVKIVILSAHADDPLPSKFIEAGARGYLTKGTDVAEMERAIRKVHAGEIFLTSEVAQQLALKSFQKGQATPFESLSDREMQVMLMITRGIKVPEISDTLCLSPKTVNSYRYRLFEKLKVDGDVELTHLAIRHGLLDPNAI